MTDILNLAVKDDTLDNIISGNPYYIDIKGSVNICLIRCGHEIEQCNEVYFSSMTNYGKILVFNNDKNKKSKCNIKLAFDTSNDNSSDNGNANYTFEKAFITIPSLHKLNGKIYDMETFLLFSSIQKNGNVLYVCLCTFNNGVNLVPNNDPKLLNYKLMNELFSSPNIVPDIFGTNQINGSPNPIDLSNFIPPIGLRNFYDYTHPSNLKVNFRIHQEIMNVSNDILNTLRSKITPGNMYVNFKNAISQTINPLEGLFFYFSEDLTNRYKNLHNKEEKKEKDNFENKNEIYEEIKKENKNEIDEEIKEEKEDLIQEEEEKEEFSDQQNNTNIFTTYLMFIISFALIINCIHIYFINNFFTAKASLPDNELNNYLFEITNTNISSLLGTKFKIYFNIFIQGIITFILLIFLIIYMNINNSHHSLKKIDGGIIILLFLIFINCFIAIFLNINYFKYRLLNIQDDNFSQKENFFFGYIQNKIKKDKIWNIFKYIFLNDYTNLLKYNTNMQGGDPENIINAVPGPNNENNTYNQNTISNKNILQLINDDIVQKYFLKNNDWIKNFYLYLGFIIIVFIIGSFIDLRFISLDKNKKGLTFITSLVVVTCSYIPLLLSFVGFSYKLCKSEYIKYAVMVICSIIIILSIFRMPFVNTNNNFIFWIIIGLLFLNIILIIIFEKFVNIILIIFGKYVYNKSNVQIEKTSSEYNDFKDDEYKPIMENYLVLKKELEQKEMKKNLYEELLLNKNSIKNDEYKSIMENYLILKKELERGKMKQTIYEELLNKN